MGDNNKYSLWDEVHKLQNKETNDFSGIVEALREICEQMEKVNFKKDEYKPKREKFETRQQKNNKIITIELNELYMNECDTLYKINTENRSINLQNYNKITYI